MVGNDQRDKHDDAFSKNQPIEGETILRCPHRGRKDYHWYLAARGIDFTRPDGTNGTATWICACDLCNEQCGGKIENVPIASDGVWMGNAPVIKKDGA